MIYNDGWWWSEVASRVSSDNATGGVSHTLFEKFLMVARHERRLVLLTALSDSKTLEYAGSSTEHIEKLTRIGDGDLLGQNVIRDNFSSVLNNRRWKG